MLLLLFLYGTVFSAFGDEYKSHLLDPSWQEIISEGGMYIGAGRAKRFIAINDNQPNVAYQGCVLPNGEPGQCRPLRHCIQEEFRSDFIKFMDYVCIIQQNTVGACCPDQVSLNGAEGLAGDLPAIAPREEQNEAAMKVIRAESRGCGQSTRQLSAVRGARQTNPREWPWMASIKSPWQGFGGVLITDRHVMTAVHCTRTWKAEELFVRLGEYDFKRTNDSRIYNFRVAEIREHEDFELPNYKNDIAILKLDRPAIFNSYVWPICLPPPNLQLTDELAVAIGWGTQYFGGPRSNVLMEVTVPVWDHDMCVAANTATVFNETLCAAAMEGGKDTCQGDSGGPLMYQLPSGRWTAIGLVSWGSSCGEPKHPAIYISVAKYLGWIKQNARF